MHRRRCDMAAATSVMSMGLIAFIYIPVARVSNVLQQLFPSNVVERSWVVQLP